MNNRIYGKDFSWFYNKLWGFWGPKMWPVLQTETARLRPAPTAWLDLCCGTGSLLELVSQAGYEVTGIDRSEHQLAHAHRRAPKARLIQQDIRQLSVERKFGVITCMFDSLNYLTASRDLLKVFHRAAYHLAPGGLFAFDMNTLEGLKTEWCRTHVQHEKDLDLTSELSFDPRRALGHCLLTGFTRTGRGNYRRFQEEHIERGYEPQQIETLLTHADFTFRKRDGNTLGPARRRSSRLLYFCRHQDAN